MLFNFSHPVIAGSERNFEKTLGIIPGLMTWAVIISVIFLSFFSPFRAVGLVVILNLYWFLRFLYMIIFLLATYSRLYIEKGTDWLKRAEGLDNIYGYWKTLNESEQRMDKRQNKSLQIHRKEIQTLKSTKQPPPHFEDIKHLVIIPVLEYTKGDLKAVLESVSKSRFPLKNIIVILSIEESAVKQVKLKVKELQQLYRGKLMDFFVVVNPAAKTKRKAVLCANLNYTLKRTAAYFEKKKVLLENVILTYLPSEGTLSRDYLACLTYNYMVHPDRTQINFQPILAYNNNIWKLPSFSRIFNIASWFFPLVSSIDSETPITFFGYSLSFRSVIDVKYWPENISSDSPSLFWKAFIRFDGLYRIVPIYAKMFMGVKSTGGLKETAKSVYWNRFKQCRSLENFPIVVRAFLQARYIPLTKRIKQIFRLVESYIFQSLWPVILCTIGWLPLFFVGRKFSNPVFYYCIPRMMSAICNLALLGALSSIVLTILILPKKKIKKSFLESLGQFFEWIFVPIVSLFLSALPALHVQTMFLFDRFFKSKLSRKAVRK